MRLAHSSDLDSGAPGDKRVGSSMPLSDAASCQLPGRPASPAVSCTVLLSGEEVSVSGRRRDRQSQTPSRKPMISPTIRVMIQSTLLLRLQPTELRSDFADGLPIPQLDDECRRGCALNEQ
jgi:hypothetical protein